MDCERFTLPAKSQCVEKTDVFYIPTDVVHATSARGDKHSLIISFGLLRKGLIWSDFMVHLLGSNECLAPLCEDTHQLIEFVLRVREFGCQVWNQVPLIAGVCTTNLSAPYTLDLSRDSCSTFKSADLEISSEL